MKKSSQVYIAYFWVHSLACLLYLYMQKEGIEWRAVSDAWTVATYLLHTDIIELLISYHRLKVKMSKNQETHALCVQLRLPLKAI